MQAALSMLSSPRRSFGYAEGSKPFSVFQSSNRQLGAVMLCCVLLLGVFAAAGCSGVQVAQNIVNFTPALESAVATVDSTAALLLPADAPIFVAATVGFDAAIGEVDAQAKAYLANPTASVLAKLQTAVVTAQQTINDALLRAAGITDKNSEQHALAAINGVGTIVVAILGLVQSISSKAAVAQMAAASPLKLAAVRRYMDERKMAELAGRGHTTVDSFFAHEAQAGF